MSVHSPFAPDNHPDPQRKPVLNLYAALAVAILAGLTPSILLALVGLVFLAGVLAYAYRLRARSEPEGLAANHATYVIRTIWIGGVLALLTTTIGGVIMLTDIDYTPFDRCAQSITGQAETLATNPDFALIWQLTSPCMDEFLHVNMRGITIAGLAAIVPVALYFALRFIRGLSRAIKGYRIANPKMWL